MKGLLHSKRFKKLLKKWLCIYVGVMVLFTSVVTYSKYITSNSISDDARITKFSVTVLKTDKDGNKCCKDGENENCTLCTIDPVAPTKNMEYYFTVNTLELEVASTLKITVTARNDFELVSITPENGTTINIGNTSSYTLSAPDIVVSDDKNIDTRGITLYKVVVRYKPEHASDYNGAAFEARDIITVGFSATQKTRGGNNE